MGALNQNYFLIVDTFYWQTPQLIRQKITPNYSLKNNHTVYLQRQEHNGFALVLIVEYFALKLNDYPNNNQCADVIKYLVLPVFIYRYISVIECNKIDNADTLGNCPKICKVSTNVEEKTAKTAP